jgi:hypothetical protein
LPPPNAPVFFSLALHRRRRWILDLEPMIDAAKAIGPNIVAAEKVGLSRADDEI